MQLCEVHCHRDRWGQVTWPVRSLHTAHCTLYTAHCTLPTIHCKLHMKHIVLLIYITHSPLHAVHFFSHFTIHSLHRMLHTEQKILQLYYGTNIPSSVGNVSLTTHFYNMLMKIPYRRILDITKYHSVIEILKDWSFGYFCLEEQILLKTPLASVF